MISKNEILAFQLLPTTVSAVAEHLHVSVASASKTADKLVTNGLARKQRNKKTVLIIKEQTILAQKLNDALAQFPRLPLHTILTHSHLAILSTLTYPLKTEELSSLLNVTRQWIHKAIRTLSTYGLIINTNQGYLINPTHRILLEFATYYNEQQHYRMIHSLTDDGFLLWHHGTEFLMTTQQEIPTLQPTAITMYPPHGISFITQKKYYYHTHRLLDVNDIILHTILINPNSKTYNSYALLLMQKTSPQQLIQKARLYNLSNHVQRLNEYLNNHIDNTPFLPPWDEYQDLKKQYKV